jgi:tyrosine-protein kinase Etk/Wzc
MTLSQDNQPNSRDKYHLLDYLIVVAKHGGTIFYATLAAMTLSYIILLILPNQYTAATRILPPQEKLTLSAQLLNSLGGLGTPGTPASGIFGGGMAANFLGLKSPSDLYAGMMTSNTISDSIIKRFHLRKLYKAKYIEDARNTLKKRAEIHVNKKDGVISIEVTDKDAQRAAAMANAFAEELDILLQRLIRQEASTRLAFLEKERLQASQNLSQAENALRAFSEKNNVLQINTQTRQVLEYIARLRAEVDAKEVQAQVLRQQATPNNYDVVRLETEVKALKNKLKNVENRYDQNCVGDVCLESSKVPTLGLDYFRLYREVKFQEWLYQFYIKMVELARLDTAKNVSTILLMDRALPPEKRSNKRLPPVLVIGLGTFSLVSFVMFARENWEKLVSSRSTGEILRWQLLANYLSQWWHGAIRLVSWFKFLHRHQK